MRFRTPVADSHDGTELYISVEVEDTESAMHSSAILGLQNRSLASVLLGYNPESCKIYSKLRIIYLFCPGKERIQSVLFTETISEGHAFNDGRAVVGTQLKLHLRCQADQSPR